MTDEPTSGVEAVLRQALEPFAVAGDMALISGRPPGEHVDADAFLRARAALATPAASPSPAPAAVEDLVVRLVKPLEWQSDNDISRDRVSARGLTGSYHISPSHIIERFKLELPWGTPDYYPTRDEAKAAAQADYTARILSALDATALSTLAADKARLEAERDEALGKAERQWAGWVREGVARKAAEARASALEGEVERLRGALEPFAAGTEVFFADDPDDRVVSLGRWHGGSPLSQELPRLYADIALTVAHFRRARAAIRKETTA